MGGTTDKTRIIGVRLPVERIAWIEQQAKERGIPLGTLVREVLMRDGSFTDQRVARKAPRTRRKSELANDEREVEQ